MRGRLAAVVEVAAGYDGRHPYDLVRLACGHTVKRRGFRSPPRGALLPCPLCSPPAPRQGP